MTRKKLAVLGLSALALVATSVFVASNAQATGTHVAEFTCLDNHEAHEHCDGVGTEAPTHENHEPGQNIHDFVLPSGAAVTCKKVKFEVTTDTDGTSTEAPTTPLYNECGDSLGRNVVVHHNECHYEFHVEALRNDPDATPEEYEGSAEVVCPEGKQIEITIGANCEAHVPPQETIGPIYFRNMEENSPTDVTVEATDAETTTNFTQGFFVCGTSKGHHISKYTGNTTVQSFDPEGTQLDARVD